MHDKRRGFTILELTIYIVIFAIVGTLGAAVFDFTLRAKNVTSRLGDSQTALQQLLSQIVDRVYSATDINGASTTLNLKMAAGAIDPTIFSLASGTITMKEGAGAAVVISPDTLYITALSFSKISNANPGGTATSSVQIRITGGYNEGSAADPKTLYTLQTTALSL